MNAIQIFTWIVSLTAILISVSAIYFVVKTRKLLRYAEEVSEITRKINARESLTDRENEIMMKMEEKYGR